MEYLVRSIGLAVLMAVPLPALAQDAAEMARKLQDPLANIKALMTDNDINFNSGNNETSYGFQLQPVYAVPFEGFNLINRAVVPILGMPPESQRPIVGPPLPPGSDYTWGFGDALFQFFFSPRSDSAWKWGAGPMVSLKTRTGDTFAGPGWGGGPVAVLVGGVGNVSIAFIGGHVWAQQSFSLSILQPMIFYNIGTEGWTIGYSNIISHDWNASAGNEWTVPLGLGVSKAIAFESGIGVEPLVGYYYNAVRPQGAGDHTIKWAVSVLF